LKGGNPFAGGEKGGEGNKGHVSFSLLGRRTGQVKRGKKELLVCFSRGEGGKKKEWVQEARKERKGDYPLLICWGKKGEGEEASTCRQGKCLPRRVFHFYLDKRGVGKHVNERRE